MEYWVKCKNCGNNTHPCFERCPNCDSMLKKKTYTPNLFYLKNKNWRNYKIYKNGENI